MKSGKIREALAKFPHLTNRELKLYLRNQNVEVSDSLIYNVRNPKPKEDIFTKFADQLMEVKGFCQDHGGISNARELISEVEEVLELSEDVEKALDIIEAIQNANDGSPGV